MMPFFQRKPLHINALDKASGETELYSLILSKWKGLWKISALSGHFQRYPHPDCSGKLKEVSSSVWAAARWGRLYYISIYFPQHLSNFSQARLTACSISDNLKLCWRSSLRNSHRLWALFAEEISECRDSDVSVALAKTRAIVSVHITRPCCKIISLNHENVI